MESLVVPDISVTIFLSSPKIALVNDDFPTLGLPRIDILGKLTWDSLSSLLILLETKSSNSPVP